MKPSGPGMGIRRSRLPSSLTNRSLTRSVLEGINDLARGSFGGRDRAVNRCAVSLQIRCFPGEIQSIGDGLGQQSTRSERSGRNIAVSAPGEWIGAPIMKVNRFQAPRLRAGDT